MLLSVFFLISFIFPSYSGSQEVIDRIAAVVNDYVITLSDVKITISFNLFEEEDGSQEENFLRVLNGLINQKMVIGLIQENIPVGTEAVETAYQSLLNRLGNETVQSRLDFFGMQKEDLEVYLFEKILFQKIIENRFGLAVRVSLREIEEFYEEKYIPAQITKNMELLSMMDVLEEIEAEIKKEKISLLVGAWLNNLRRQADLQIFLKEEMI